MRNALVPERTRKGCLLPWMCEEVSGVSGATAAKAWKMPAFCKSQRQLCRGTLGWGCSMSAAAVVLTDLWASSAAGSAPAKIAVKRAEPAAISPELAFYRKYTEGMLRRYMNMSMESGRVPSLLGKEMFRGRVTNYRVQSFEDVVIFVHDVGKCLRKLSTFQQLLIERIALQQYTQGEAAAMLGLSLRTVVRRYGRTLDELTAIFLANGLLEPMSACQERKESV